MACAWLTKKRWFIREWLVDCDGNRHRIRYAGWELATESVYVDGILASRRTSGWAMSHRYQFVIDDQHSASLSVAIPWWAEFLPLCDLRFARLELNGEVVYEEGRAPVRTLRSDGAVPRGFAVGKVPGDGKAGSS